MKRLILVTGGAASGKSEYAEMRIREVFSASELVGKQLVYLATMFNDGGPEAAARIQRHRKLRQEKGFETIERPCRVEDLFSDIGILKNTDDAAEGKSVAPEGISVDLSRSFVLLEDLGNLLANEMYLPEGRLSGVCKEGFQCVEEPFSPATAREENRRHYPEEELLRKCLFEPLQMLAEQSAMLVIVSNEIFSDGEEYAEETMRYIRTLGLLHRWLSEAADEVTEVVCGLPLQRKERAGGKNA